MRYYYASGLPYSDELYHHGILGQKWGIRRFQNKDGTRTPAGKKRYSSEEFKAAAKKAGEAVAKAGKATVRAATKATKTVGKAAIKSFKRRHPSFMSDEELRQYKARLDLERSYKQAKEDLRNHPFRDLAGDVIKRTATTAANKLGENFGQSVGKKLAERMFESENDRELRRLRTNVNLIDNRIQLQQLNQRLRDSNDRNSQERQERQAEQERSERQAEQSRTSSNRSSMENTDIGRGIRELNDRREQQRQERQAQEYRERIARLRAENARDTEERRNRNNSDWNVTSNSRRRRNVSRARSIGTYTRRD